MSCKTHTEETNATAKGRYCVKCKTYVPVANFNTGGETTDSTICNIHACVEQALRYCRGCDDFIALDLFPRKIRPGYVCRKHMNTHGGGKQTHEKRMADPTRKRLKNQWEMYYRDCRKFKHSCSAMSFDGIELEIKKVYPKGSSIYAVMPVDTTVVVGPQNVVVVTVEQRKMLLKLVKSGALQEYTRVCASIKESYQ